MIDVASTIDSPFKKCACPVGTVWDDEYYGHYQGMIDYQYDDTCWDACDSVDETYKVYCKWTCCQDQCFAEVD